MREYLGVEGYDSQIAALQDNVSDLINDKADKARLLYSGSFTSGTLTVPDISKYQLLLIRIRGNLNVHMICMKDEFPINDHHLDCHTLVPNNVTTTQLSAVFSIPINGDVITYPTYKTFLTHATAGAHAAISQITSAVTEILGIM